MRKRTGVLGAAVGLGVAMVTVPQPARAECSAGALMVCATVSASTYQDSGGWHLVLKVWNLFDASDPSTGLSHVITFVGIGSSWSGTASLYSATVGGNAVNWKYTSSLPNNPVGAELDLGSKTQNGVNQGLVGCNQPMPPGEYQTCYPNEGTALILDFKTSSAFTLTDAVTGYHSQAINGTGCSLWWSSDGKYTEDDVSACTSSVPEPVTLSLLATGLAGMGGVGLLRRRRRAGGQLEA